MSRLGRCATFLLCTTACAAATPRGDGDGQAGAGQPARTAAHARLLALLHGFELDERAWTSFLTIASDESRQGERALVDTFATGIGAIDDADLDVAGRVDLHLIRNDLARTRTRLDWDEADGGRAAPLVPFVAVILEIERNDRDCGVTTPRTAPLANGGEIARAVRPDGRAIAAQLDEVTRLAKRARAPDDDAKEGVAKACADALAVRAALRRTRECKEFLDGWLKRDPPADPELAFWVTTPANQASVALGELATWLEGDVLEGLKKDANHNAFAIGRERYVQELKFEGIGISPEEMLAFGETQLKALQAEIRAEAVRVLGDKPEVTWQAGLELEKADQPPIGAQKDFVYDVAREAVRFCDEQQLFPVPPLANECWRLKLSDLETQKSYAYGFYGGNFMGVASPLAEMDSIRKLECLRSNARPTTRTVVPHELIPGHHLQAWFARRNAPQRDRFESPFYGEGWAVHCERTFDEHGFFKTPVERIGHLFWRLLRAARIVVSTKYHLNQMSAPQMVDFMVENAGLERSAATAEVHRYMSYSPLYQCAYLYGCQQIRDLRDECRRDWGGAFSEMRFNTEVLEQGSIPIKWVREALLATH